MNTVPTGGGSSGRMPAWAIVLMTCCGGCALVVIAVMVMGGLGIKALLAPKVPPPAEYVGVWQGADSSVLAIGADGVASFRTGGTSISGGRVKVDSAGRRLSIKLAGLGQDWRVDAPPKGEQMKLNGVLYKRTSPTTSGMLSTSSSNSPE
jgi:hypothetical protein